MTTPNKPEAEVVSVDAGGRRRVHFAGRLEDAVDYVKQNFPRPHVEPGSNSDLKADVFVQSGGKNIAFHGESSGGNGGWHNVDDHGNVTADEEPTPIHDGVTVDPPTEEEE